MAVLAVWLVALVPTASRTVQALTPPAAEAGCDHMMARHGHPGGAAPMDMDACGYCTLFVQQAALPGTWFVPAWPVPVHPVVQPLPAASTRPTPALALHAPPTGPPSDARA